MAIFKERFDKLFQESEKTQEEFGNMFKANKNQVYNWRNGLGEPDTEMLAMIAKACNVSADWLIGNTNIRNTFETITAHRTNDLMSDLPPEALERVEEFKELMRLKYGKKPT